MADPIAALVPNIRTFQVFPDVPDPLEPLLEMAKNLWWVWNPDAAELFRRLDHLLWEEVHHNPVKLLGAIEQQRLLHRSTDEGYLAQMRRVYAAFREHVETKGWFAEAHPDKANLKIAYFSAEFGIHESLPIYSGGLGILAGDHLKSASELGMPLIGVGLLYRNGYFQQYLSADGWQQEAYPELDFYNLAIEQCFLPDKSPVRVRVDLPDNAVFCHVWKASVGRISLYLMDTNLPENSPADRDITARLYGSGNELRIKQEIVLGIGGVRALSAMGIAPTVFHMNEGHSAFLALERIRVLLENSAMSFDQARQFVMATNVFTTHTPVPAGIDFFSPEVMLKYFRPMIPQLKLDDEGFLALGREDVGNKKQGFSMALLAIRLADHMNGVSELHGDVSRRMWHNVWPQVPPPEVPIKHVTNGIHVRSWLSSDIAFTLDRYMPEGWLKRPADFSTWDNVSQVPDEEIWRAHERGREKLVAWARQTLKAQLAKRGASYEDLTVAEQVLDPEALTFGFARRFATYKRGTLLFREPERLKKLLEDNKRPIQFVFAGKAHPADHEGKELIKAIVHFARESGARRRIVFIENYDMSVARYLVQGVDVWLNTPRRPYEASGTSGMKAAANGVLNCSILDGWWVEGYSADLGWAIGRGEDYSDPNYQDHVESQALYDLLEKEIIPTFYNRTVNNIPRDWIGRMKNCMRKLAPVFNTNRMVKEYADKFYMPADTRGAALSANGMARAAGLAQTKDLLRGKWPGIRVVGVHTSGNGHFRVGESMQVEAMIDMPGLSPKDVQVQLYCGRINARGEIEDPAPLVMQHTKTVANDRHVYVGKFDCRVSGRQGFAVRILPGESDLASPFEPGLILWN
ncbi:alpha-glucan family phosphorylase [Humisphaera borealis]|uniref:Alpha-glucan family phosphorylase n=1 Tax=Humisphaera borealis TaxID=2807512 RepID=A0A7M2WV90_9BACT|nr:alpha-glucan family phosphorylase [Humisphaera borealis]QOV89405.1 alpha-glucan family phosphorylase [Humisphaera borealis]